MSAITTHDVAARRTGVRPVQEATFQHLLPNLTAKTAVGLLILAAMVLATVFAPLMTPYNATEMQMTARLQAPSWAHIFGTDLYGRDLFSRIVYGGRITLSVSAAAVVLGASVGSLLGVVAGMRHGWVDRLLTQVMDAWLALPAILVALVMAAALGRTALVLTVALGVAGVPSYYRIARVETQRIADQNYVEAVQCLGATPRYLFLCHIIPNILPTLGVMISLRFGRMLIAVSSLSFIGLGVPPPAPEWGALLAESRDYIHQAWWLMLFPGLSIALTVYAVNLLSDGLRDLLDPTHHTNRS